MTRKKNQNQPEYIYPQDPYFQKDAPKIYPKVNISATPSDERYPDLTYSQLLCIRSLRDNFFSIQRTRPEILRGEKPKKDILEERGNRCEVCGSSLNLLIHHQYYAESQDSEVERELVLCARCHRLVHKRNWIGDYPFRCPECGKIIYFHPDLLGKI